MNVVELRRERNVAIVCAVVAFALLVLVVWLFVHDITDCQSELYCGSKDMKRTPVYNETSGSPSPIGYKCCKDVVEKSFDSQTGDWNIVRQENCYYVSKGGRLK